MNYILDEAGDPVREDDILAWALWFSAADRTIGRAECAGGVTVSTVFLGLDHRMGPGAPLLFETMVFGGPMDEEQERYTRRAAALEGHARWVHAVCGVQS